MKMNDHASFKAVLILLGIVSLFCLHLLTKDLLPPQTTRTGIAGAIWGNEENSSVKNSNMCLSFEEDVDQLISDAEQIYITAPAKCAGSAMISFMDACDKNHANLLLRRSQVFLDQMLTHSMTMPKVIADHTETEAHLLKLLQSAPTNALIIYIYREESDRVVSAIKHIVQSHMCIKSNSSTFEPAVTLRYEGRTCIIESESRFIESVIKPRFWEIGMGIYDTLTCKTHEAIEKEGPNMIMVNYKQVDRLQEVIAKYRCPNVKARKTNAESQKQEAMIQLQTGKKVSIKEWANSKKGQFGFLHDVKVDEYEPKCRAKTRMMEKEMLGCKDEVIRVSG